MKAMSRDNMEIMPNNAPPLAAADEEEDAAAADIPHAWVIVEQTKTENAAIVAAALLGENHIRARLLTRDGTEPPGADYARAAAEELGIAACFTAFLPKPHVLLDDQPFADWRRLISIHPMQCESESVATYRTTLANGSAIRP